MKTAPASDKHMRITGLILFGLAILGILVVKAIEDGWFVSRTPLELNDRPALLFFNRYKGCECQLLVYRAAQSQIDAWSNEDRQGVQIIFINLDHRPDLAEPYQIIRAPSLVLVDSAGKMVYKQDNTILDDAPLNLAAFEQKIKEMEIREP